jgi:hypothetical protein
MSRGVRKVIGVIGEEFQRISGDLDNHPLLMDIS